MSKNSILCVNCGDGSMNKSGIRMLDEIHKLENRIKELEKALKVTRDILIYEHSYRGYEVNFPELEAVLKDSNE